MKKALLISAMLSILHIPSGTTAPNEVCKKVSDAKFCATLLQPYAAQMAENDPLVAALASMNATLGRVDDLREFMVQQAVDPQTALEDLTSLTDCLINVGEAEGSVKVAVALLKESKGTERDELLKMIDGTSTELTACVDTLKQHKSPALREAVRLTHESILACSIAKSLLP